MGYILKKYSTFFKSKGMLYLKESLESRKVAKSLIRMHELIYKKIPENVEVKHLITKALKEETEVKDKSKKADDKSQKLAFNIILEEEKGTDAIKKIEDAMLKLKEEAKKDKNKFPKIAKEIENAERLFGRQLYERLNNVSKEDRDEYRDILNIVKAAGESKEMISALRAKMIEDPSMFKRWLIKLESKSVRNHLAMMERNEKEMEKGIRDIELLLKGKNVDFNKAMQKLNNSIKLFLDNLQITFESAFKVLKRDFQLILILIKYLNDIEQKGELWIKSNLVPPETQKNINTEFDKIKVEIGTHIRNTGQGIRILEGEIGEEIKEAERIAA